MKKGSPYQQNGQPGSPRGVNFFKQFARQFLRPYGQVEKSPSDITVYKRIKPFTCEWLLRPKVALSELADTILKNNEVLQNAQTTVLNPEFLQLLNNELLGINDNLRRLIHGNDQEATMQDVVETLKFLYRENEEFDTTVDQMFEIGGALFLMATQIIVSRTLVRTPEQYAQHVEAEDGSDKTFQREKDIISMRDFIVNSVLGTAEPQPQSRPRKNLISQFDSPSKSNSRELGATAVKRQRLFDRPSTSQGPKDSASDSSSEDEVLSLPKPLPTKDKRKNPLEILAEDEPKSETKKENKKNRKSKKNKK